MGRGTDIPFRCPCGSITGMLLAACSANGTHVACHCRDCRAALVYCDAPDPAPNPVPLYQTTPAQLRFDSGLDQLKVFSFGPKNILRWRAGCCGAPMFNTLRNPKISFVGLHTNRLTTPEALGRVRGYAFVPTADGKTKHIGTTTFVWGMLKRSLLARLSGRWKENPLFDVTTAQPITEIETVPTEDRKAILKRLH